MKFIKNFLIAIYLFSFLGSSFSFGATNDCFEGVNRGIFSFNKFLDDVLFKPVAKGYTYLPDPVKSSVRNVTSNISYTVTIPNHLLQGHFKNFANDSGRFIINSTFGILGIFDPATKIGLNKLEHEDYGQTLGKWGVGPGCYVMLPILGPSTSRDAVGKIANTLLDPFYMVTVGKKTVLDNNFGDSTYYLEKGFDTVDFRAQNLNNFDNLEKNSIDLYASVKSLYLQRRESLIGNNSAQKDEWKDFK
jgi:phospholipid-binding lipoprotein MlaA